MRNLRVSSVDLSQDLYTKQGGWGYVCGGCRSDLYPFFSSQLIATNSETKISLREQRPQIIKYYFMAISTAAAHRHSAK